MHIDTWRMLTQLLWVMVPILIVGTLITLAGEAWRALLRKISGRSVARRPRRTTLAQTYRPLPKLKKGNFSIHDIDRMSGEEFEQFVERLFLVLEKENIIKTELTPPSGDQGCDVIIHYHDGGRLGIQCKRHSQNVTNTAVQNIVTARAIYGLTMLMVFTNSFYTDGAKDAARMNHVELVDRTILINMIRNYNRAMVQTPARN
ncbi:restriction endonuclease [Peptococcaceae bacterium CEB3]|nr:restriction endonuclease [Peptococcaceae bacterium CEB3]